MSQRSILNGYEAGIKKKDYCKYPESFLAFETLFRKVLRLEYNKSLTVSKMNTEYIPTGTLDLGERRSTFKTRRHESYIPYTWDT